MTRLAVFLWIVALSGCSHLNDPEHIEFVTEGSTFQAGDEVPIRLINGTSRNVGYNICFAFVDLESKTNGAWEKLAVSLGPYEMTACTAELRGLAAGGSAESVVYLPDDLPAGAYRLSHEVEINGRRQPVTTEEFRVDD